MNEELEAKLGKFSKRELVRYLARHHWHNQLMLERLSLIRLELKADEAFAESERLSQQGDEIMRQMTETDKTTTDGNAKYWRLAIEWRALWEKESAAFDRYKKHSDQLLDRKGQV